MPRLYLGSFVKGNQVEIRLIQSCQFFAGE